MFEPLVDIFKPIHGFLTIALLAGLIAIVVPKGK